MNQLTALFVVPAYCGLRGATRQGEAVSFLPMYAITDWDENYETSDSRKTSGPMDWYKARTRTNGIKFAMMMREKDAAALFGCWHIFLSIAAAQKKGERGKLTSGGKALTAQDIELMTRISSTVIQRALDFFSSQDIGWMFVVDSSGSIQKFPEISGDFQKSPEVSGSFPTRIEENRREEKRDIGAASPSVSLKSDLQRRAEKLHNKRESTPWDRAEIAAWKHAKAAVEATTEDEWKALEYFYSQPQERTYARKSLAQTLNNWGEAISKAQAYAPRNIPRANIIYADDNDTDFLSELRQKISSNSNTQ